MYMPSCPEESRLKVDSLQFDHDIAAELEVVEEQVAVELVAADLEPHLATDECEALAEFKQEPPNVVNQALFEIPFSS